MNKIIRRWTLNTIFLSVLYLSVNGSVLCGNLIKGYIIIFFILMVLIKIAGVTKDKKPSMTLTQTEIMLHNLYDLFVTIVVLYNFGIVFSLMYLTLSFISMMEYRNMLKNT